MFLSSLFRWLTKSVSYDAPQNAAKETLIVKVTISDSASVTQRPFEYYVNNRKKLERKEKRMERHRLRWSIIRHFVEYDTLCRVNNIYDFKKSWERLKMCTAILSEYKATEDDFKSAYRLIRIKYIYGEYPNLENGLPEFPELNLNLILNPDKELLLDGMYNRMKEYWDEVVMAYKTNPARKRRVNYLINRLSNEQQMPLIADIPAIVDKLELLKKHYASF